MPRVWSALLPDACRPAQKMLTAADATEVQAKAAIRAVAQEVVRAGHVCSAAVAKLQATLDGSDTGNTVQIAEHVAEHHAQGYVAVEPLGGHDAAAAAATEAAVPAATLERSVDIHMGSVDTPVGSLDARPQLTSNGGQDHIVSASHALKSSVEQDSHPASLPGFVPQSGHQINASDVAFANETDDGYIGLENQSAVIAADTDVPRTVAGYVAAAESSDSQGSLPEIDSGEYSDSSSDQ